MTQFLDDVGYDDLAFAFPERGMMRHARIATAIVANILFAVLLCAALCGCANTPTGVRIVASSATATNLGDINWDEYKIPVFSIYTGPKTTIWINRDYVWLKRVTAEGVVTNDTSALGIYSSKEQKKTCVELELEPCATNILIEAR